MSNRKPKKKGKVIFHFNYHNSLTDYNEAGVKPGFVSDGRLFVEAMFPNIELRQANVRLLRKVKDGKLPLNKINVDGPGIEAPISWIRYIANKPKTKLFFEPHSQSAINHLIKANTAQENANMSFIKGNFNDAVEFTLEHMREYTTSISTRRKEFVRSISARYESSPDKDLHVILGAVHTHVLKDLKEKGIPVKRVMPKGGTAFAVEDAFIRANMFGKKISMQKKYALASAFLPQGILQEHFSSILSTRDRIIKVNEVLNRFSVSDFERLCRDVGKSYMKEDWGKLADPYELKDRYVKKSLSWMRKNKFLRKGE